MTECGPGCCGNPEPPTPPKCEQCGKQVNKLTPYTMGHYMLNRGTPEESYEPIILMECDSCYGMNMDVQMNKCGRNEKCPCGSGRKYKKCCGG